MSAQGSSVKGSSQQSSTSVPKVKGGGPLFSGRGPLIMGGVGKRYYTGKFHPGMNLLYNPVKSDCTPGLVKNKLTF